MSIYRSYSFIELFLFLHDFGKQVKQTMIYSFDNVHDNNTNYLSSN